MKHRHLDTARTTELPAVVADGALRELLERKRVLLHPGREVGPRRDLQNEEKERRKHRCRTAPEGCSGLHTERKVWKEGERSLMELMEL